MTQIQCSTFEKSWRFYFSYYLAAEFYEHRNMMPKQKVNGILAKYFRNDVQKATEQP